MTQSGAAFDASFAKSSRGARLARETPGIANVLGVFVSGRVVSRSMPAALETWSAALPLRALLRDFGSPVYVLAEPQLLANVEAYVRVLGAADRVAYPVKANPAIAVLEILARAGCRADCASPAELRLAQLAGFPGERIVYNSPAADLDTAFRVLERGGTVVADSAAMLRGLDAVLAGHRLPGSARLLVRVNPRAAAGYAEEQDYQHLTAHADPRGKFGVPAEELPALVASVRLEIQGVHAHVGTQMDHVGAFATIARELHAALDSLPRAVANPIVDLGGGLGIPFVDGHCFPSIDDLAPALATVDHALASRAGPCSCRKDGQFCPACCFPALHKGACL